MSKTITILSSKGGVGKTFVTVNLATVLALSGQKVLLLDFDFQAGQDMARMLNLSPRASMADVFPNLNSTSGVDPIREAAIVHTSGLHFLSAVRTTSQINQITSENIKNFLKKASVSYDFILVDAGKTFTEALVTVLDHTNLMLLVATPDILSVYQVKWSLDVLQSLQFPMKMIKLVLNRSESRGSVAWQEVRSALPCEILSHIPSDGKTVGIALNRGIPCVIDSPKSGVSESFYKMGQILIKDNIYVASTEVENLRSVEGVGKKEDQFWQKFGISQQVSSGEKVLSQREDEFAGIKRKLHEKLIERLNLDGIALDTFNDQQAALRLKKRAEEVVSNLLLEEAGGKISSHEERSRLVRDVVNEALGLGPLEDLLADPDITDIMVNNYNEIYVEKSGKLVLTNKHFISNERLRSTIERIIAPIGRRIDESTPMVDARLPDGSRFNAIIPPLSLSGPMATIRKFSKERVEVTDLLNKYNTLSKPMADFLQACVLGRKNIIVSGGTGAGKTTLLNVISEFIPDNERIITIEDAAELKLKKSHWGRLESRPSNIEGKGAVTIRDLFINCLRMRPDRIVIGECRGPEALDMLQAMNTGHDGSMTTLHANSTRDVITRMHSMILLSGIELPVRAINEMISSAIQIIVHINRYSDGTRKITGITETIGLDEEYHLKMADVFIFRQSGMDADGHILGDFEATGYVPLCFKDFKTRGMAIEEKIFSKDYKA
jgi:septum site-determining protein MinD